MINIEKLLKELLFCIAQHDMASFDNEYRNKYLEDIKTLKRVLIINYDLIEDRLARDRMEILIEKADHIETFIERISNK